MMNDRSHSDDRSVAPKSKPRAGAREATPPPYRSTPIFDETTLPLALRSDHSLKAGAWGLIQVLEGQVRLTYATPPSEIVLSPGTPGRIAPEQVHSIEPLGPMRMRVDFYDQAPDG